MPRIQIELAPRYAFSTDVQVYISHVNQGGHLDNAQLLSLVSEARTRFFRAQGYTEGNVEGCHTVVGDMVAQYKSEAFYGETLRVSMQPADFNRYGFDLQFVMVEVGTGREVARGKTGIVFIGTGPAPAKVTPIPPAFLAKLQAM